MPIDKPDSIFATLQQQGPFAAFDAVPAPSSFGRVTRLWVKELCRSQVLKTKYRLIRNQIFEFLDVNSFAELHGLIHDRAGRQRVNLRAYRLLANMFGIEGNDREIVSRVNRYAQTADEVITVLRATTLSSIASHIEITNEIETTSSPVDLLLIIFDQRYHKKARFEAKRKLTLMQLAGSIDQRERETCNEGKFAQFLDFLNAHVWSRRNRIGQLEIAYLVSVHDPENFACTKVRVITPDEAEAVKRQSGRKITLVKRRRFQANGREVPIYVTIRKKQSTAKVLKLLRKNEKNPAVAVDDELGLMGVLDSVMDVKIFQHHLTRSATKADSFMTLEQITDTLGGGNHSRTSVGSSPGTPMLKFFARMGGMRVEFILHTNASYLNYIYQRGVAHDEYEIKRLFDSGVAELLFPRDIYHLDMERIKDDLIRWSRRRIEER